MEKPTRRYGKFEILWHFLDSAPEELKAVFRDVIVVRAESLHHRSSIDYIGICDAFRETYIGDEIPRYLPCVRKNEDGSVTMEGWEEVPHG